MRSLHVAVAQVNSRACDPQGNLAKHRRQAESAAAVGVEALLFAETSLHAYDMSEENKAFAEAPGGPLTGTLSAWADEFKMTIMAGFLERDGGKFYNSHAVAMPGGKLLCQRKHAICCFVAPGVVGGGCIYRVVVGELLGENPSVGGGPPPRRPPKPRPPPPTPALPGLASISPAWAWNTASSPLLAAASWPI